LSESIVVWLRRDLRLHDNPALHQAGRAGNQVVPVYIHAPQEEEPWPPGAASRWWLHHSLRSLEQALESLGSWLIIRRGDSLSALRQICTETGAHSVYWNRLYDPATVARDERIKSALHAVGIATTTFPGYLIREPWEVTTGSATPYKVFTPYSRASLRLGDPEAPVATRYKSLKPASDASSDGLDALGLLPRIRWDAGFYDHWQPGELGAWRRLETFIESAAAGYAVTRDQPGVDGISRLSPHLHFGELSPRALWHAVLQGLGERGAEEAAQPYLRQLLWRDFAHQLLFHFPEITTRNFKPAFDAYPWREDSGLVDAWQRGATGIPLVDAGMRELWHTGFMHNRVRMNVASFLTKNAGVHWRTGAEWFWNTLLDANLANNTLGWQWVAGSGPDAAPYFRIFNPVTQAQRFDPQGLYARHWIPKIAGLPDKYIHAPWTASAAMLADAGIELGRDYPRPVLDLKQSRQLALEQYQNHVKTA